MPYLIGYNNKERLMEYSVIYDFNVIDENFGSLSPYNLSKDCKGVSATELADIANNIVDELKYGPRTPAYVHIYKSKKDKDVSYSKIRCADKTRNEGKSKGYRCVILVDNKLHVGYLLHLYKHSSGEDDISKKDKNTLKNLVESYVQSKIDQNIK